jgi:peptide/nickel transport system permease protein
MTISVPLALAAARKKDGTADQTVRAVPIVGLGMPAFWLGIMLILLLAAGGPKLFPVGGYGTGVWGHLRSMFLPALTVAIGTAPLLIRSLRTSLLAVLESDYVTTARAKGIPERRVLLNHALRNGIMPMVTVLGINLGFLIGNTVVVEKVFALPGVGALIYDGISQRDFSVVQGVTLVLAAMVVFVNLAIDLTYSFLDPRVRFD